MAQAGLKSRVGGLFAWARRGKGPVEVDIVRREGDEPAPGREVTIQQMKQGYGEVVETMKSVRSHLETQSDRSQRMLELLEGLPIALRTLPESAKAQAQLLEVIQTNLARQNEMSGHLTEAITGLRDAAHQQDRTLDSIREHLAEESVSRDQMRAGLDSMTGTLESVEESNRVSRDTMATVAEQSRRADEQLREMFRRSQRTATAMTAVSWALAIIALAVGLYVAMMVSQAGQANGAESTPAPTESADVTPDQQSVDTAGADREPPADTEGERIPEQTAVKVEELAKNIETPVE